MKTVVRYALYFSRKEGKPFLSKTTMIFKGGKLLHCHEATVVPKYDWQLENMFKDFRAFLHEEADENEVNYGCVNSGKYMFVKKTWEG